MKDEFRSKLEEKKKEIDDCISKENDENRRSTFMTLRKELDNINSTDDLESRIAAAGNFKRQAKKDSTRAVFEVFEKELKGLRSSLSGETAPPTKEAVKKGPVSVEEK